MFGTFNQIWLGMVDGQSYLYRLYVEVRYPQKLTYANTMPYLSEWSTFWLPIYIAVA